MSQENAQLVARAVAAVNERDIDGYLACCTENVELRTPLAALDGLYRGEDGIRQFFANIQDAGPDFRLDLEQLQTISEDRVLAFLRVSASGRTSGIAYETETTNLYDLSEGKISRIRIYTDRAEALEAAGLSE